ncbi:MAG: hypothetical protein KatS3mg108_0499 [Isosphaeraceae bacterium]|jgi:hypothetical protein|nr:MAG: hypothetical protein KatS3mg108_0499 [Isosphaeraceae bacterium]
MSRSTPTNPPNRSAVARTDGPGFGLFEIFAFQWGVALVAHTAKGGDLPLVKPHELAVTLSGIWLMLGPGSVGRLVLASVVALVAVAIELPFVTNHWMFMTFTHIAILAAMGVARLTRGGVDRQEFFQILRPALAVGMILLYALVTLCKLNGDFLSPEKSSAAEMYSWLTNKIPGLADTTGLRLLIIWSTLAIEGGLPILLAIPATRHWALLIGWAFHLILGFNGFYDFSALVLAGYVAFLPDDFAVRLHRGLARRPALQRLGDALARLARHRLTFPILAIVALTPVGLNLAGLVREPVLVRVTILAVRMLWVIQAVAALLLYLIAVGEEPATSEPEPEQMARTRFGQGLARAVAMLLPVLTLFNGLCPYLGLKTESAFTMFSNLQTEGDYWNHLFLPRAMRIFPMQDDLVTIIDCPDPEIRARAEAGNRWVEFEFRDLMSRHPDWSVVYEHRGVRREVPRVGDDPELSRPTNPILRKLVRFREVVPPERNYLRH